VVIGAPLVFQHPPHTFAQQQCNIDQGVEPIDQTNCIHIHLTVKNSKYIAVVPTALVDNGDFS
jgi:hypothetical protein